MKINAGATHILLEWERDWGNGVICKHKAIFAACDMAKAVREVQVISGAESCIYVYADFYYSDNVNFKLSNAKHIRSFMTYDRDPRAIRSDWRAMHYRDLARIEAEYGGQ